MYCFCYQYFDNIVPHVITVTKRQFDDANVEKFN